MPMIQDGEFNGYVATSTSFDTSSALFDFFTKVKRPLRVGTRRIQNSRDIVVKNDSCEEANIDVATELKYVVILPIERVRR